MTFAKRLREPPFWLLWGFFILFGAAGLFLPWDLMTVPPQPSGWVDGLGRPVLGLLLRGTALSLMTSIVLFLGVALAAGSLLFLRYLRPAAGPWIERATLFMNGAPFVLVAVLLTAATGNALAAEAVALVLFYTPLVLHPLEAWVIAGRRSWKAPEALGAAPGFIFRRHILLSLRPILFKVAATAVGWLMLADTGFSFLGLGLSPPLPNLGHLLRAWQGDFIAAPPLGAALVLAQISLVFMWRFLLAYTLRRLERHPATPQEAF